MNLRNLFLLFTAALSITSCNSKNNENITDVSHPIVASAPIAASTFSEGASAVQEAKELNLSGTTKESSHETFKDRETAYVIDPTATVEMGDASILLPIGTPIWVKQECSYEMDSDEDEPPSVCVYLGEIYSDGIDWGFPDGLAPANSFSHKLPKFGELLEEFDKTPVENRELRREYAQKATALDPWSKEAHDRLITTLTAIGDQKGIDAAEASFKHYLSHQVRIDKGELPTIFYYKGDNIVPLASIEQGIIKAADFKTVASRGKFLHVYSDQPIGFVVTTWSFSPDKNYPAFIPVISIGWDGKPNTANLKGNYATNFPWSERHTPIPSVTGAQKTMLIGKLREKITRDYSGMAAANAEQQLKAGKIDVFYGQLSADGRKFLIGSLQIGSASDEHYNDIPYVSEIIIMEQQKDGNLAEAQIDIGKLREGYCNISGILRDIDGDGTDEVTTYCNAYVEGPGGDWNGLLQRVKNSWVVAF